MECPLEDDSAMLAHLMEQDFPADPLCSSPPAVAADSSSSYCYHYYSSEIENIGGSYGGFFAPHFGYTADAFCLNEPDAALGVPGPPVCSSAIGDIDLAHFSEGGASSSDIGQSVSAPAQDQMLQAKRKRRASSNVEKSAPSKRIRSQTWQDVNGRQIGDDQEPSTNPQSLYARKRRERINARLKILQDLVPNGTKVDISTMLEEAVHYVKFLQLQIKLLSSDELWMYAPIAYNGINVGLDLMVSAATQEQK